MAQEQKVALVSESLGTLAQPLERYLGKRSANALAHLDLRTVRDLLFHVPFRLARRGELMPIEAVREGDAVTIVARVLSTNLRPMHARRGHILSVTVSDGDHEIDLTFFSKNPRPLHFHANQLAVGAVATFSGTISSYRGRLQLTHPDYELLEDAADLDAEAIARPIPIYHAGAKAPSWKIARAVDLVLERLTEADVPDLLPTQVRSEHGLMSRFEAIRTLHHPKDDGQWQQAKRTMAYEEAFVLQVALAHARAVGQSAKAPACPPATNGTAALLRARLPFALTTGQLQVENEISADLASTTPMRRLLQGDVGTGKTIVALLAMLQAVDNGAQAAVLAPTEVLATQHYETFMALLGELGYGGQIGAPEGAVRVELLKGSMSAPARRAALAHIASGSAQIVIGTHALLQDSVQFARLGLVVVDEQHRFGVDQRDRLSHGAHLLVMTATPIPRTIAMTTFGDLDVSSLTELPRGRAPIHTTLVPAWNEAWMTRVWERAREEIAGGGRVYVVCSRIDGDEEALEPDEPAGFGSGMSRGAGRQGTQMPLAPFDDQRGRALVAVEELTEELRALPVLAGVQIEKLHSRLSQEEKQHNMQAFARGEAQMLVATTMIEVGVDVPEASMMVIMDADRFGLSQLHQLRGRIGRGARESLCLAVYDSAEGTIAMERLRAFERTTNGFELAERDLELRSEGNVLGAQQSGDTSSLRFLSVLKDGDIIEEAKREAGILVSGDPDLEKLPKLAEEIARIEANANTRYIERN